MNRKHDLNQVIKTGEELFWDNGYNSIGTQEIIKKSKMTRGAFYNAFDTKENYLIKVLSFYINHLKENLEKVLKDDKKSPFNRLKSYYINEIIALPHKKYRGCLLNDIMSEIGNTNKNVANTCNQSFNEITELVSLCIKEAIAKKEISNSFDGESLAHLIQSTYYGALTTAKISQDNEKAMKTMNTLFLLLEVH